MNSEKRFLVAVLVSFLILVFYPVYLKWVSPKSAQTAATLQEPVSKTPEAAKPPADSPEIQAPSEVQAKETIYPFSHQHFDVEFSARGAVIKKLVLKSWSKTKNGEVVLIDRTNGASAFLATIPGKGANFENKVFTLNFLDNQRGEVQFSSEDPGRWRVVKTFRFGADKPIIQLSVEVENLGSSDEVVPVELTTELNVDTAPKNAGLQAEAFMSLQDKVVSAHLNKLQKKPYVVEGAVAWQALVRHYFTVIVRPDEPAKLAKTTVVFDGVAKLMQNSLQMAAVPISPGQKVTKNFLIYAGPRYFKDLKAFGYGFEQTLLHGAFGIFRHWLLTALQWCYQLIGNYGWAIVLITFLLKLLFTPLTHMSFESMKKMQALQPKLKALQEQHKGDQAKLSKEMMELYKKHKVNPMGGCLPMVLQIPIFIAFYQVLAQTVELKGEPFIFWIRDLSEPDRAWTLPFSLPLLGDGINILPLLMLGSMVWQQRLTPQTGTPEQQKIMMIMPLMFGFIFYSMPSGLVLYWFLNNMLSIFHQLFIKGKALPHHEE
ncbi:MAG: membrane protein insertase YidC [Candidatus Omnitrophica bacterium]|nr:membrane protein insertase YidC [Candidatus Omnitrophota bacterium]